MNIKEKLNDYLKRYEGTSRVGQYMPKIKNFILRYGNCQVEEALTSENIRKYILNTSDSPIKKRVALLSYYSYLLEEGYELSKEFPVSPEEAKNANRKKSYGVRKKSLVILDKEFDLEELFCEDYYMHLNSRIAKISAKAVIGLCLSIGFDAKELFGKKSYLRVGDVLVVSNNKVRLQHHKYQKEFIVNGPVGEFIVNYSEIRKGNANDPFFVKLWDGNKELDYDMSIYSRKPPTLKDLVYYMLKYICEKNNVQRLSITDLRANMSYRSLVKTKGASLVELIKVFGYVPFVKEAFHKYTDDYSLKDELVTPFFNLASSESDLDDKDEAEDESKVTRLVKRFRDRKIVEELKSLYNYKCQICGTSLKITEDIKYVEAHHLIPLSHEGDDMKDNMIILCPNHHKLFDEFIYTINPENLTEVIRVDGGVCNLELKHIISRISARYGVTMQNKLYGE